MIRIDWKPLTLAGGWLLWAAAFAFADTLTVGGDTGAFDRIQAALNAANPGDTVLVAPGTYREGLSLIKQDVSLIGSGSDQTVVESDQTVVTFFPESWGNVQEFTFRYTGAEAHPVVLIVDAAPTLGYNQIWGGTLAGVEVRGNGEVTLVDNAIRDNAGSGVLVHEAGVALLDGNTIERNGLENRHAGVEVRGEASALLRFNRIWRNGGSGVFAHQASQVELEGNSLIGNHLHGVALLGEAGGRLGGNSIWWNQQAGVRLQGAQPITLTDNVIAHNGIGLLNETGTEINPQQFNTFVFNLTVAEGGGLSTEDNRISSEVLFHPQGTEVLRGLEQVGVLLRGLEASDSDAERASLIALTQRLELILADVYRLSGRVATTLLRLQLVVRLDPEAAIAAEAQAQFDALQGEGA